MRFLRVVNVLKSRVVIKTSRNYVIKTLLDTSKFLNYFYIQDNIIDYGAFIYPNNRLHSRNNKLCRGNCFRAGCCGLAKFVANISPLML